MPESGYAGNTNPGAMPSGGYLTGDPFAARSHVQGPGPAPAADDLAAAEARLDADRRAAFDSAYERPLTREQRRGMGSAAAPLTLPADSNAAAERGAR